MATARRIRGCCSRGRCGDGHVLTGTDYVSFRKHHLSTAGHAGNGEWKVSPLKKHCSPFRIFHLFRIASYAGRSPLSSLAVLRRQPEERKAYGAH